MTATPTGGAQPRSLRLEFSKAADASRIETFLSSENRAALDRQGLTQNRLAAIAGGTTDRNAVLQI